MGGTDDGLHHQSRTSMSGHTARHGGPQVCTGKIPCAALKRPIGNPEPSPGGRRPASGTRLVPEGYSYSHLATTAPPVPGQLKIGLPLAADSM